jgi:transcriptional regulator with XRE-family HTH domain
VDVPRKQRSGWRSAARHAPATKRIQKRLGKRIRALRQAQELTQEKAAERAQIDPKHLQEIEAGQHNVTLASLVGLAKALDVTLAELFEDV